jgi:hypothetical protein
LFGRVRTPQAASMLAGRPVPIWSSIASALRWVDTSYDCVYITQ